MPAVVAPEHFQTEQSFIAALAPELAGSLEPALGLSTGGFHGSAANGLVRPSSRPVIHAGLMCLKVGHFLGDGLRLGSLGHRCQCLLQLMDYLAGGFML